MESDEHKCGGPNDVKVFKLVGLSLENIVVKYDIKNTRCLAREVVPK